MIAEGSINLILYDLRANFLLWGHKLVAVNMDYIVTMA